MRQTIRGQAMDNKHSLMVLFLVLARPGSVESPTTARQPMETTLQPPISKDVDAQEIPKGNGNGIFDGTRFETQTGKTTAEAFVSRHAEDITVDTQAVIFPDNDRDETDTNKLDPRVQDVDYMEMYRILNETRNLCPYTSYCGSKPLLNNTDQLKIPCCQDCSCDPECGRHGDCCHSNLDKYKFKDKYRMKCLAVNSECPRSISVYAYYMIDTCLETDIMCSDQINTHRTFYPVFSPSRNLNFYNEHCALCNGVNETVSWTGFVICRRFSYLETAVQNGLCDLEFDPPDIMPRHLFACIPRSEEISSCPENGSEVSDFTRGACASIYSPVKLSRETFQNMHCLHCNNVKIQTNGLCLYHGGCSRAGIGDISMLIDYRTLEDVYSATGPVFTDKTARIKKETCGKNFIKHPFKEECRPLLCPYGQYRLGEDCRLLSETWDVGAVALVLVITLEQGVPEKDLINSQGNGVGKLLRRYNLNWKETKMLYFKSQEDTNSTTVTSLLIVLTKLSSKKGIDLPKTLGSIASLLQSDVKISVGSKRYTADIEIYRSISYRIDIGSSKMIQRHRTGVSDVVTGTFHPLSGRRWYPTYSNIPVVITKLFFCSTVKILQEDFEVTASDFVLFPNTTGQRKLVEGEFVMAVDGERVICAEDFNRDLLTVDDKHKGQGVKTRVENYLVYILFCLCLGLLSFFVR